MIGRKIPTCCMGDRCSNAHDSKGRKMERRVAKRREKKKDVEPFKENPYHEQTTERWEDY